MPRKLRQLRADLKAAGAFIKTQEGSHQKWAHPQTSAIMILAGKDGKDAQSYQERDLQVFIQTIKEQRR
ncbi:MAG TPA: type II toxin-antitoxin system HicA family toxin [Ktedonobacteraceae bacterium]|nr:type II toxin-antitoxin system HicA family toxin [Ktedonobacteraceae bacterium]